MLKPAVSLSTTSYRASRSGRRWAPPTPASRLRAVRPGSTHSCARTSRDGEPDPVGRTVGTAQPARSATIPTLAVTAEVLRITRYTGASSGPAHGRVRRLVAFRLQFVGREPVQPDPRTRARRHLPVAVQPGVLVSR